jgi:hypothetical protein
MSNFVINIAEGAYEDVKAALAAVGHELQPVATEVETVYTDDVKPALAAAEALIQRNGGQLLITEAIAALGGLATGNWSAVVTTLVANAEAAGATTLAEEKQLAGSTALQVAQALKAQQQTTAVAAPATEASAVEAPATEAPAA